MSSLSDSYRANAWIARHLLRGIPTWLIATPILFAPAHAQTSADTVAAALKCFEDSRRSGLISRCPVGVFSAEAIVRNPQLFSPSIREATTTGLEQIVLTSDTGRARSAAAILLASLGDKRRSEQVSGVVQQLRSLFERTDSKAARAAIIWSMRSQEEESEAIAFLQSVITESNSPDRNEDTPAAYLAVGTLARMGAAGRSVLATLHASDTAMDGRARGYLNKLAERGFEPKTGRR